MQDKNKTKAQLIEELLLLRERIADIEAGKCRDPLAQESILDRQKIFDIFAENSPDWEYLLSHDGTFLFNSPSCVRICGYFAEEFNEDPKLLVQIIYPEDLPLFENHLRVDQVKVGPCELEFRILHRDGTIRWIEHACLPVFDEQGALLCRRGSNRDITRRKLMEDALLVSEKKYRELIDSLQEGIWIMDGEGNTTFMNPRMAQMLGYTQEETLGRHFFSFISEKEIETYKHLLRRRKEGIKEQHEFELIRKDGTPVFTIVETFPTFDLEGKFTGPVSSLMDITERKKHEETVRENEERFRLTFDQAPIGAAMVGLDLSTMRVNRELCRILGRSEEELLSLKFPQYTHQEDIQAVLKRISSLFAGEIDQFELEKRFIKSDGKIVHGRVSVGAVRDRTDKILYLMSTLIDITVLRETEMAARDAKEQLQLVIDALPVLISYVGSDHCFKFNNKLYEQWTGLKASELYGMQPREIVGEEVYQKIEPQVERAFSGETVTYEVIVTYKKRGTIHAQTTLVPHRGLNGEVKGIVALVNDVTESRAMEEKLRISEEHFRCTFDQAPLGAALLGEDFRYQRVNSALCELTGYTEEELLSLRFTDITHPEHVAADAAAVRRIFAGELDQYQVEKRYIRKDGRIILIRVFARLVRKLDGSPSHLLTLTEDITEHREIRDRLLEAKERLSLALEASGAGTWNWDYANNELKWDGFPHPIFGIKPESRGTLEDFFNVLHPDDRKAIIEITLNSLKREGRFDLEYRVIWPDGSVHDVIDRGRMYRQDNRIGMARVCLDITDRKLTENALHESQALLSTIIESIPFELWAIDVEGRFMLANSACLLRYGNIIGKKPHELFNPETAGKFQDFCSKALSGEPFDEIVQCYGTEKKQFLHRVIVPIVDKDQLWGTLGISVDITEQKTLEEGLRKARDELESRVRERTKELDEKSNRLEEFNAALKILLKQREEDKRDLEQNILASAKSLVIPYIDKLKNGRLGSDQMDLVAILESHVNEIISPFAKKISEKFLGLTPQEVQVASLIRDGKTTHQIAEILCVSEHTVSMHRFHIRKKLGLINKKANLQINLQNLGN